MDSNNDHKKSPCYFKTVALNDSIQKSLEYSEDSENLPLKRDDHTEPGPDDDLNPKVGMSDDSDYDSDEAAAEEKLQVALKAGQFGTCRKRIYNLEKTRF